VELIPLLPISSPLSKRGERIGEYTLIFDIIILHKPEKFCKYDSEILLKSKYNFQIPNSNTQ